MSPRNRSAVILLGAALLGAGALLASPPRLGAEDCEILVRVPQVHLGERSADEVVVEYEVRSIEFSPDRRIDPSSFQIARNDAGHAPGQERDLEYRWYDSAVPYDFPECEQNLHATDGRSQVFVNRPRWGDFYNVAGDGEAGRLVWMHRQSPADSADAVYRIRFQLVPSGTRPQSCAKRGFTGDGASRCAPRGTGTTGMIHSRVTVADWNGDGLTDLLVGGARGQVLFYPNRGTTTKPSFEFPQLVMTDDGRPLDTAWSAAPLAVDWNGDGRLDLVCGAERNRVIWYENTGTASNPRLQLRGFVAVGADPLALPVTPVPKAPAGVFTLDYYPVLDLADWNGDGRPDLLAGGYITGRIYQFEATGRSADGTPLLRACGPLVANGMPLNVGDWAAAPCAADFDGDGDLDLISGNMPLTAGGGDSVDHEHFLRYYENCGTATDPQLVERPFPREGAFPGAALGTPRAADWNGDGLLDLVVSAGENIWLYANVGTSNSPRFAVDSPALPGLWGSAPLPAWGLQLLDDDGDGRRDLFSGLTIYHRRDNSHLEPVSLLPAGTVIDHPPERGDAWRFTQLADLDGDGLRDLVFGTHAGNIWLHRRLPGPQRAFDVAGVRLELTTRQPLQVGPLPGQSIDFDVLQGARTSFAVADFDGDECLDLVVGDTYGKVRYYRNEGTARQPVFAVAREIGDLKIRMVPSAADWDGDGTTDVIGASAAGAVVFYRNLGAGRFAGAETIPVPQVPCSPFVTAVDWNDDGDVDLLVGTSYGYTCWFERSFLERGYVQASRQ